MKNLKLFILLILIFSIFNVRCSKVSDEKKLKNFINEYEKKVYPTYRNMNLSYWKAAVTGDEKYYREYEKYSKEYSKIHSDKKDFEFLKSLIKKNKIKDKILKRELKLIYLQYLQNQLPKELREKIITLSSELEKEFSTYRGVVDGKEITTNEVYDVLKESKDSSLREKYWKAQKLVGKKLEKKFLELVKLRNKSARKLGFKNYYSMMMELQEMDEDWLIKLFDEMDELTRDTFLKIKSEIDEYYSKRFGVSKEALMPWHYEDPYFQEGVSIFKVDLDRFFKGKDLAVIAELYYSGIGLEVEDILKRSSLFEAPGKNPHAFEISIDRGKDVRVLLNLKDNHYWMDTILHELGHAVYSKYISEKLPFVLRQEAHMFVTEAVAMFFGRLATNPYWLRDMKLITGKEVEEIKETLEKSMMFQQIIFSRWAQVMVRFERELYYNPSANLNELWWELKTKYQNLKKPENWDNPDYLSKIHITAYPVYYHNYMLGELLASQFTFYLKKNVYKGKEDVSFTNKPEIGKFFKEKIFAPGAKYHWSELVKRATGEDITPEYFADQFIKK